MVNLTFPRRQYQFGALGALSGDSLVRANTVVNSLTDRWSQLQRDIAEAVQRGEVSGALLGEVDAIQAELDRLGQQIFDIEPADIAPWISWSQDIARRLAAIESRSATAIEASRRIRATKVGMGLFAALGVAGVTAYFVQKNRKKGRR